MSNRLKSRNIHSEIVFCLGPNNNIATTLNTFGISDKTTDLLVVKVTCPSLGLNPSLSAEGIAEHLRANIQGEIEDFGDEKLRSICDVERVKAVYKLGTTVEKGAKGRRRKDGSAGAERGGQTDMKASGPEAIGAIDEAENGKRKELEVQILGLMALRGAM